MSELLPCPFCGAPAENCVSFGGVAKVRCTNSGNNRLCAVGPATESMLRRDAIALWNRRHAAPEQAGCMVVPIAESDMWETMDSFPQAGPVLLCHENEAGQRWIYAWEAKCWHREVATRTPNTPRHLIHADAIAWRPMVAMPGDTIRIRDAAAPQHHKGEDDNG